MSKKPMIIVGLIFGLIIIALTVYLILSLTTDLFKTSGELFQRYFTLGVEKVEKNLDFSNENEYINGLLKNNYKENTKIDVKYLNSKNENEIFNIVLSGITNNSEKNSYKTIGINYGGNGIMSFDYLRENQTHGFLFKDVVKQFISANEDNLEEILNFIGIKEYSSTANEIIENVKLFFEKKDELKNIILKKTMELNTRRFSKQSATKVTLNNGEEKIAKVYSVKLTEDEVKELCVDILNKLDKKEEINTISNNSIKLGEIRISIYTEKNGLLKLELETKNGKFDIDFYENEINIKCKIVSEENINSASIDIKREDSTTIKYEDSNRNNVLLKYNINKENNNRNVSVEGGYKNDYIKEINMRLLQTIETSESAIEGIDKKFESLENVNLSGLKENERNVAMRELLKKINGLINNKNSQMNSEVLDLFIKYNNEIETKFYQINERKKKAFNNQFLPYEGQNVEKEVIYNLLDLVGGNIEKYGITGEDKYRIYILEGNKNTKMVDEIKDKIKESDKEFNVKFEYDSAGKISVVRIQGFEKKN